MEKQTLYIATMHCTVNGRRYFCAVSALLFSVVLLLTLCRSLVVASFTYRHMPVYNKCFLGEA